MIRARRIPEDAPWHSVPFALWSAAHHLDDLPGALRTTAEGLGDVDTTCAITAGIVSARTGISRIPRRWLELGQSIASR